MRDAARIGSPLLMVSALISLSGCQGESAPATVHDARMRDAGALAAVMPDSTTLEASARVLRAFLDASRETTRNPDVLDTLTACGDDGTTYFPSTLLAGYTLLPFESRGDTLVGRAEVVTVAEVDVDRRSGSGFIARERIRTDVLEWDVIPTGDGRWVVCNGLRFGARGADSLTTWRPDGGSYERVRRLADSIVAVRR
jgi:hypothetical protein